ncbi:amidohydrolase family protein [Pontibacter sp. BT310]|uniref:Amidohydrolase family protein n=1 Tax=Pontibacter populi TaxID=890055 RepID=A0ABS6X942_9BACT|nr:MULTISPECIES: amidohydrolase family protein [Pontibacter]MBJ6116753.1 amidohydrolase family protein [Pontibacter sp. BT310]MBR0569175.1 amidohydrolase family protein [Microvirga sp. STS03]MBW3363606.1 amidohydrolase family protein [Pontibacter populi]
MKIQKRYISAFAALLLSTAAFAQVPAPAVKQSKPVLLKGATLHVGNGTVVENAAVGFENGKITYAGPQSGANLSGYEVVDVTGQHIYPGLIQPNSSLGLNEIESVRATIDWREVGDFNPNVRSVVAYNTDSDIIPTVRANGVLMTQLTPIGGTVAGSSSVVQLDAWNWEDAVVKADEGIHLNWPAMLIPTGNKEYDDRLNRMKDRREETLRELGQLLSDAAVFKAAKNGTENLKLSAMAGLFDGSKKLYIHTNYGKEIIESVNFVKQHGVKDIVIVGAGDALAVADFLKANNIPVIYSGVHALPSRAEEDVWQPYKTPYLLHKAGIQFALDYDLSIHGTRNLPFIAGTAAAFGLDKEQALSSVTLNTAKILGIDKQAGSVEVGKDATIVVSSGDLLDMRTNNVTHAFIAGRKVDLNDKQLYLYKKFDGKYKDQKKQQPAGATTSTGK